MLLLLVAILIVLNGLFVLAEMSLVSSRRSRLQARAARGDRGAQRAIELIETPTRYLSTIQIVITLTGIAMGMLGEEAIAADLEKVLVEFPSIRPYAHAIALTLTGLVLLLATLLFGELVPKRLGQMFPEGLARRLARPLDFAGRLVSPVVSVLSWLTNQSLKLLPFRPRAADEEAEEEVRAIIASGTQAGVFHEAERLLVDRVFRLGDQKVTAIMVPRADIDYLEVDTSIQRVRVAVATSPHSHFPVCGKGGLDELIGVVHVKDLVKHGLISDTIELKELARPPVFVPESKIVINMLGQFQSSGTHIAFVVDEYGAVIGLLTLNDIVGALIGEITAGGPPDPMIVQRADGSYLLDGQLSIADLKTLMGVDALPAEDTAGYETVGGFTMTILGRIPATADRFPVGRFVFEIVDMDRTRVDKVLMSRLPDPPPAPE